MKRATIPELLNFGNKVRDAGGGNPISGLMPGVPEDSSQCIVAANLNFDCEVSGSGESGGDGWYMQVASEEVALKIGAAIDQRVWRAYEGWRIALPPEIGKVASDFDRVMLTADRWAERREELSPEEWADDWRLTDLDEELRSLVDLWPYIQQSEKEEGDLRAEAVAALDKMAGEVVAS